jgi:hypothetical protein
MGTRSFESFTLGLAVLLFADAVARMARVPRPIAYLMGLSGLAYLVQGWAGATERDSRRRTRSGCARRGAERGLDGVAAGCRAANADSRASVASPMKT